MYETPSSSPCLISSQRPTSNKPTILFHCSVFRLAQRALAALRAASLRCAAVSFFAVAFPPSRAISVTVIGFGFFLPLLEEVMIRFLYHIRACAQFVEPVENWNLTYARQCA